MNEIDWIILALLLVSTIVGIMRGMVRETLAIVGWIVGAMLALRYAGDLADQIPLPQAGVIARTIVAAVVIVVLCLVAVGLFGALLRKLMEVASLSFEDRILGAVFGFIRGILVTCVCVFVFGLSTQLSGSDLWKQSALIGPAQTLIDWSMPYLPKWVQDLRGVAPMIDVPVPLPVPSTPAPKQAPSAQPAPAAS